MPVSNNPTHPDELFMLECLLLARKGMGFVSPNPLVGAVLVKKGRVIGRGYHRNFGGPHAESDALQHATEATKGSTLYVNLEPCNHHGKTPPCTEAIINAGISRVVIGMKDPNPGVTGGGIRKLKSAGIHVDTGILAGECARLNESFVKYVTTGLPFVTLKIAQTLDGKIADSSGSSKWITHGDSRKTVHELRRGCDAILVGASTVRHDNPQLTLHGLKGRSPLRVVVSGRLRLPPDARIFSPRNDIPTLVVTTSEYLAKQKTVVRKLERNGVGILSFHGRRGALDWTEIFSALGDMGISSILVEGGATIFSSILNRGAADKAIFFVSPNILGGGLNPFSGYDANLSSAPRLSGITIRRTGPDMMISGYFKE